MSRGIRVLLLGMLLVPCSTRVSRADRWQALESEGIAACEAQDFAHAEELFQSAIEVSVSARQKAILHNRLGDVARWSNHFDQAGPHYTQALALLRSATTPARRERAWAHYGLAQVADQDGASTVADSLYDIVFEEARPLDAAQDPLFARFLYGYATHLGRRQDFGSAMARAKRAIAILSINPGESARTLPGVLGLAVELAHSLKDEDAARSYAEQSVEVCRAVLAANDLMLARARIQLGQIHLGHSEFAKAVEVFAAALPVEEQASEPDLQTLNWLRARYAEALIGVERYRDAESLYGEALAYYEKQPDVDRDALTKMRARVEELRNYLRSTEQAAVAAQQAATRPSYETRYSNGTQFQIGTLGDLQVWVAAWKGSEIEALIYVVNGTDRSITFDPGDVLMESVSESHGETQRTKVKTFTAQQWETKISNSNQLTMFFSALGAGLANTPQPQTTYVSGSVNDSYGYGSYYGTITTWPSQSEIAEANARTQAQLQSMNQQLESSFSAMSQTLMRVHTLDPHSYYGGKVHMNKRGKNYVMTVPYAGVNFEFSLQWE